MGTISYDPIKNHFARFIRNSRLLRRIFYFMLDLFFLRSWHIRRILRKECGKLDKQGSWTLLDAGCGFGQYDRFILEKFNNVHVVSVDIKEDYLEDCRRYFRYEIDSGRIEFRKVDLFDIRTEQKFDFVLCIDVLEHIEDDLTVIRNLVRSLKPGGSLLMHSPSHLSRNDAGGDESFVGEHARAGYSESDIREKYHKAGLLTGKIHYTYGRFGHIAWVLSIKYPMLLLNRVGIGGLVFLIFYYPIILPFCLLLNLADLYTENETGNGIYALGIRR